MVQYEEIDNKVEDVRASCRTCRDRKGGKAVLWGIVESWKRKKAE